MLLPLPPELLAQIVHYTVNSTSSPFLRRQHLLQFSLVSHTFLALVQYERLRSAFIDSASALTWLSRRLEDRTAVEVVQEVTVVFKAGREMLGREEVLELLGRFPKLHRLELRYEPSRFAWERLKIEGEEMEALPWAKLADISLTNISLDFSSHTLPIFSSLHTLSFTESRFTLPSPHPSGAVLPASSFPALLYLSARDAPNIDYLRLPYLRPPVYHPRYLLPIVPQLKGLLLDPLLVNRLNDRVVQDLLRRLEASEVPICWELQGDLPVEGAKKALLEWMGRTRVRHFRLVGLSYVEALRQLAKDGVLAEMMREVRTISLGGSPA
ncbi:hypothetical protein JCM11641_006229 [Rhodosporidiobolus odoratus]